MKTLLENAIQIALEAHDGQVDKAGTPYILHPLTVMQSLKSIEDKVVGVLHDVIEDSEFTKEILIQRGIPENLADDVEMLSRKSNETYDRYLTRLLNSNSLRVLNVKDKDLEHNLDRGRLDSVSDVDMERMKKYANASIRIKAKIKELKFFNKQLTGGNQ